MFITLTRIKRVFTPEAEQRYEEFQEEVSLRDVEPPKDENGYTAQYYEDMGLPIPEELLLKSKNEDYIEFDLDTDYVIQETSITINTNFIVDMEDVSQDETYLGNTYITLIEGRVVNVIEDKETINKLLK